tara:strand:+ start:480 stop:629 length:150 start_codon:yes stop_codon:yes gene_type:complete
MEVHTIKIRLSDIIKRLQSKNALLFLLVDSVLTTALQEQIMSGSIKNES